MTRTFIPGSVVLLGGLLSGGAARAQESCTALPGAAPACLLQPSSLIVTGSQALERLLLRLQPELKAADGTDIYYVLDQGQCNGARQVTEPEDLGGKRVVFLQNKVRTCCDLPAGAHAQMWVSDSAIEDCFDGKKSPGVRDDAGPIASYAVVVPKSSAQRAITAEEAYFVFGFGNEGYRGEVIAPWSDAARFFTPPATSGPLALWAKFLGLPHAIRIKGLRLPRADDVIPRMVELAGADAGTGSVAGAASNEAIGLTSTQAYESSPRRAAVRALAIQAWKQKFAFYPDSTSSSFDKRNVREGRYPFWAPLHLGTRSDQMGRPLSERAASAIRYLTMKTRLDKVNMLDAIIGARLIPSCAMKVQRAMGKGDAGEQVPYTPPPGSACGCYMDELIARGSSGCQACSSDISCSGGKMCSNGFCE